MDDAVKNDEIEYFISFVLEANKSLLFAFHAWATMSTHTFKLGRANVFCLKTNQMCLQNIFNSCLAVEWQ